MKLVTSSSLGMIVYNFLLMKVVEYDLSLEIYIVTLCCQFI